MRFTARLVTRDTKVLPDKVFPEPLRGRRYIPGELYAEAEALRSLVFHPGQRGVASQDPVSR